MADIVRCEFEKRWSGDEAAVEPVGLASYVPLDDLDFTEEDLKRAVGEVTRPWIKDVRGIPVAAMLGGGTLLQALVHPCKQLLSQDVSWDGFSETGYVRMKELGCVSVQKTRGIVPQSTFVRVLTNLTIAKIKPLIDDFSQNNNFMHRVLGANKGGQILHIVSCCQHALELGRHDYDGSAVAQMDIRTYHDRIDRGQVFSSLISRGVSLPWCLAALRTQRCPQVNLKVKSAITPIIRRQKGAMTGSRLAAFLERILVEDAFLRADAEVYDQCFRIAGYTVLPFAWSDNIVFIAKSVRQAAQGLRRISQIKAGSAEIVFASTRRHEWQQVALDGMIFDVVSSFRCLGYILACNGDTSATRDRMLGALRGALCNNHGWLSKQFVPQCLKARWWKQQISGSTGWIAPFVILGRSLFVKHQLF